MSHYKVSFVPNTPNHCWNNALRLIDEKSTVLDVGCSTGAFGEALIEYKNCTVDGVEPDEGDYKKAKKVLRSVYHGIVEDAITQEFAAKKYDHIVFMDVIEHLVDPIATLAKLKGTLADGGSIVFSIPNMAHISTRLMLLDGEFDYGHTGLLDNTHLHFYTKQEIERIFAEAGYKVTDWANTEATYPPELLEKELQRRGLTPSKRALKKLLADDAQIFQYVGSAVPKDVHSKDRQQYSPDPQGQITTHFEAILVEKDRELSAKQREVDDCNAIIKDLQTKLSDPEYMSHRIPARQYAKALIRRKAKKLI